MDIDATLSELSAALVQNGYAAPTTAPAPPAALSAVDAAIAPLQLPSDVRALWERVEPASLTIRTHPQLIAPDFALRVWQRHNETEPPQVPRRLFPLCYESWVFTFVELHQGDVHDGGAMFAWEYGGADFELAYNDVSDWLDVQIDALRRGETTRAGDHALIPWQAERPSTLAERRLERRGPHPTWGDTTTVSEQPHTEWPARWR